MHSRWDEAPAFSDLLAAIIEGTGLSQRELADLAGVSHSQVSRWKAGEHQPGYGPMLRLGAELLKDYPSLGDLTPELLRLAGYPPPQMTENQRRGMAALAEMARERREQANGGRASG